MIQDKDAGFVKMNAELENRYEHKLADQYERYDKLCEEMELMKQRYRVKNILEMTVYWVQSIIIMKPKKTTTDTFN